MAVFLIYLHRNRCTSVLLGCPFSVGGVTIVSEESSTSCFLVDTLLLLSLYYEADWDLAFLVLFCQPVTGSGFLALLFLGKHSCKILCPSSWFGVLSLSFPRFRERARAATGVFLWCENLGSVLSCKFSYCSFPYAYVFVPQIKQIRWFPVQPPFFVLHVSRSFQLAHRC